MNIVLVGVGGTGMSAIAQLFRNCGWTNIVGIDAQSSQITSGLQSQGIDIRIGHGTYVVQAQDMIIYVDIEEVKQSPEVQQARAYAKEAKNNSDYKFYHVPLSYNQFLGELSKRFRTVAIAGSKGKSSTTGMTIYAFTRYVKDFGIGIIGALLPDFDNKNCIINKKHQQDISIILSFIVTGKTGQGQMNYGLAKRYRLVVEACEYKEHFLLLDPDYSIITNTYRDHTDYFTTEASYQAVFEKLRNKTKKKVIEGRQQNDKQEREKKRGIMECKKGTIKNNTQENDISCSTTHGKQTHANQSIHHIPNYFHFHHLFGKHQQSNAQLVWTLLQHIQQSSPYSLTQAYLHIKSDFLIDYQGVRRRMELLGTTPQGAHVYSDYGHTPESLQTGLIALREHFPNHIIIPVFQPHQARRILDHRNEFINVFTSLNTPLLNNLHNTSTSRQQTPYTVQKIIYHFYTAREHRSDFARNKLITKNKLTSFDDIARLFTQHITGTYIVDFKTLRQHLRNYNNQYIIVCFTAGDLDGKIRNQIQIKRNT